VKSLQKSKEPLSPTDRGTQRIQVHPSGIFLLIFFGVADKAAQAAANKVDYIIGGVRGDACLSRYSRTYF
jgi:hypothetical protein